MSNAAEVITVTLGDKTFEATRRTAAHLEWTIKRLARLHPGTHLHVIQPCYNRGIGASEGTHDYDACLDVSIVGLDWWAAQGFLRAAGWGAWYRQVWQGFTPHIHMISLGFAPYGIKVGKYIDGGLSLYGAKITSSQVDDYYNHAYGLEGLHAPGSDHSWFPEHIGETIFNYESWEDDMGYNDWSDSDRRALREDLKADMQAVIRDAIQSLPSTTASVVWSFLVRTEPKLTARAALRQSAEEDKP